MSFIPAILQGCSNWSADEDLRFAKTAFQSLAGGYSSAEKAIDWDTFKSMGNNVFEDYTALPNDLEKESFRKTFIMAFSSSFQSSGGSPDTLKNWRILNKDSSSTVVAADVPNNRTILITVIHRDGKQKISGLEVKN